MWQLSKAELQIFIKKMSFCPIIIIRKKLINIDKYKSVIKIKTMNVKTQTSKDQFWLDEKGSQIPFNRINEVERLMERSSAKLLKESLTINKRLSDFKIEVKETCEKIYDAYMKMAKNEDKKSKGNFTWFNFDRSIKIEVSISERIEFDDLGIQVCKGKLNQYIDENVSAKEDFIKQMVTDAFSKVKNPLFLEAMDHLENSIRRPDSKQYFRVFGKLEDGSYQLIDLNFSSI
jgi:hypothetical protein